MFVNWFKKICNTLLWKKKNILFRLGPKNKVMRLMMT